MKTFTLTGSSAEAADARANVSERQAEAIWAIFRNDTKNLLAQ
jgi:hypothetical protein